MAVIRKLKNKDGEEYLHPIRVVERKKSNDHDESNWLISYADMMTLLAIFYIMLFSMSKMNTPEFEKVKKEVAEHLGGTYVSPTQDLGKFINNVLVETGVQKDATMTSDGASVSIAFHSTLFFDSMSAEISPAGKVILDKIISGISEKQQMNGKQFKIVIEGHTDSQPILSGPFPSNWELSSGRATRVIRLFLDHQFKPENLLAIGYADTQPIAESRNKDGSWNMENLAKNRRVILRVLLPDVDSIPWQMKPKDAEAGAPAAAPEVAPGAQAPAPTSSAQVPTVAPAKTVTPAANGVVTSIPTAVISAQAAAPAVVNAVVPNAASSSAPAPVVDSAQASVVKPVEKAQAH